MTALVANRNRVALALGLALVGGCAGIAARSAGRAAPEVVQGSLEQLASPESRRALAALLSSPEVQESARQLSANLGRGFVDGTIERLDAPENRSRLEALAEDLAHRSAQGVGESIPPEARARLGRELRNAMRDSAREASRELGREADRVMLEARERSETQPTRSLGGQLRTLAERSRLVTIVLALGLLAVLALFVAWILTMRKRLRDATLRRETADVEVAVQRALDRVLADSALLERLAARSNRPPEPRPPAAH